MISFLQELPYKNPTHLAQLQQPWIRLSLTPTITSMRRDAHFFVPEVTNVEMLFLFTSTLDSFISSLKGRLSLTALVSFLWFPIQDPTKSNNKYQFIWTLGSQKAWGFAPVNYLEQIIFSSNFALFWWKQRLNITTNEGPVKGRIVIPMSTGRVHYSVDPNMRELLTGVIMCHLVCRVGGSQAQKVFSLL